MGLEYSIRNATREFHRRFYPEAKAELIGISSEGKIAILFTGNMCLTCGMSDYFVDFLEILNSLLEEEYTIEDMRELDDEGTAWVVVYTPRKHIKTAKQTRRIIVFDPRTGRKILEYLMEV